MLHVCPGMFWGHCPGTDPPVLLLESHAQCQALCLSQGATLYSDTLSKHTQHLPVSTGRLPVPCPSSSSQVIWFKSNGLPHTPSFPCQLYCCQNLLALLSCVLWL